MSAQEAGKRLVERQEPHRAEETEELATKTCPQCGQTLFGDMAICYGCLYDFSRAATKRLPTLPIPVLGHEVAVTGGEAKADGPASERGDVGAIRGGLAEPRIRDPELALFVQTGDVDLTVSLPPRGLMVGRHPSSDIVLHARTVSKRHVFLAPSGWTAIVQDQGATNPALLRGEAVTGGMTMCLGDTLSVCGTLLTLVEAKRERANDS